MKIIQKAEPQLIGCRCDRCGHDARCDIPGRNITSAIDLSQFVEIDICTSRTLDRADLCPTCADHVLGALRTELRFFRRVAEAGPTEARKTYHYHAIDGESDSITRIHSILDERDL